MQCDDMALEKGDIMQYLSDISPGETRFSLSLSPSLSFSVFSLSVSVFASVSLALSPLSHTHTHTHNHIHKTRNPQASGTHTHTTQGECIGSLGLEILAHSFSPGSLLFPTLPSLSPTSNLESDGSPD